MNARSLTRAITLLAVGGLVVACTRQESLREIDWAKAALERNPDYEIVATDEKAGVFTVRDTVSGDVTTLRLGDLVAAPRTPKEPAKPAAPEIEPAPEPDPAPAVENEDARTLADARTTEPLPAAGGNALAEGPGYLITRATGDRPDRAVEPLEGPGYRIERSGGGASGTPGPAAQAEVTSTNVQRRTDPIICQGNRLMRIDGETIEFTGDAVIAENGCDLYISNARISAGGVGIIARQARVHIVNSQIGGQRGSYEASDGGEIYVARSTFTGVGRRFDGGSMTDLGGNSYSTN